MAAGELCAGVDAHKAGVPVQQHMAELAVRESQQGLDQHTTVTDGVVDAAAAGVVAEQVAAAASGGGRSYPAPDPAAIPKGPPPRSA